MMNNTKEFAAGCVANPYRIPEIINAITDSYPSVTRWIESNSGIVSNVSASNVSRTLITFVNKLISAGASMDIVKNVYSEYSVIACILANQKHIISQKGLYNKIGKLFYQILSNSSHYTIMYKKSRMKHARTIKREPTMPVELFWLIPMFLNPLIFNQFDVKTFSSMIGRYTDMCILLPEFKSGYANIVAGISVETPDSYREFIREALEETKIKDMQSPENT